jgi:N-methylhydantoinase A
VYERARLPADAAFGGPAVIEQGDATTVVEPGMTCRLDDAGNLLLEREG